MRHAESQASSSSSSAGPVPAVHEGPATYPTETKLPALPTLDADIMEGHLAGKLLISKLGLNIYIFSYMELAFEMEKQDCLGIDCSFKVGSFFN